MPELRQNFVTKECVIIATERAKRPKDLARQQPRNAPPAFVATCPFCPGNEDKTPPEVLRVPAAAGGPWQVRVVPNKFAALAREGDPVRSIHRSRRSIGGFGVHDVIIETPDHSHVTGLMQDAHVANVLHAYKARYDELSLDPRIAHITVFKNHGLDAGTSLEHPHSQLIATPVISSQVRGRFQLALQHHDDCGECMFCQMIEEEAEEQDRIVLATEHFIVLEPTLPPLPSPPIFILGGTWPALGISVRQRLSTWPGHYEPFWASCITG